jgi:hypothetical protein
MNRKKFSLQYGSLKKNNLSRKEERRLIVIMGWFLELRRIGWNFLEP